MRSNTGKANRQADVDLRFARIRLHLELWLGMKGHWCPLVRQYRQIREDLCVTLFSVHIRTLIASFDSKLADVGNTLLRQLSKYLL
jgi:hypothetical protein